MKKILQSVFLIVVSVLSLMACHSKSVVAKSSKQTPSTTSVNSAGLNPEQQAFIEMYCEKRLKFLRYFKLPANSTTEDVRQYAIKRYKLRTDVTFEDFVHDGRVRIFFTEKNRKKWSKIFLGTTDATWTELLMRVESLRLQQVIVQQ